MNDKRDPQTYAIIGAAMEAHRHLGTGFLEAVYQEALALEFAARQIPFEREALLVVKYKQMPLACHYKADFICFGLVIAELEALAKLTTIEEAQVINYLKVTGLSRGLLINFGAPRLEYKRLVFSHTDNSADAADECR